MPKKTPDKIDLYKQVTDEYYALYVAFMRSGFGMEQAFELVKAHCNSVQTQNIFEAIRRECERKNRSDIMKTVRYYNEKYPDKEVEDDD